jgi:PIN domain nuclease of toxin-antitoxin system
MSDRYLLDTHALLWAIAEPHRLAPAIRLLIGQQKHVVSVATLWELINKKPKRDAPVKDPVGWWHEYVVERQTTVIPIRGSHVLYLDQLPWHHKDPYDRILMAQSVVENVPLVTADAGIWKYGINLKKASL